jgi:hypothetical protein
MEDKKVIYMTYKRNIPEKVKQNWIDYNNDYEIDFSFDKDCIDFLKINFNNEVAKLFQVIKKGMFKADLWRICKLYRNSGIYSDIDLVPYFKIDDLDKNISFYSCLAGGNVSAIFQAIIINFSKPKHPLFLVFLLSFIINKAYNNYNNGPTYDMYNCIKYILGTKKLLPHKKYEVEIIKIKICIGRSLKNLKIINLTYFPEEIEYTIKLHKNRYNDSFHFKIINNQLIIKREDKDCGWGYNHYIDICFPCKTSFFFFQEYYEKNKIKDAYVIHENKKILDSRIEGYDRNKGFQTN